MRFIKSWRWFGPEDPVSLDYIEQIGVEGIVTSLLHIPVGDVWPIEEIQKRKHRIAWRDYAHKTTPRPLQWLVTESVNVHESIKTGAADRDRYIENYIQTIKNLAACDIRTVCYNFMPVLDWVRSHYQYKLPNGAEAIRFDLPALAAFDIHVLQRENAEADYSPEMVELALETFQEMTEAEKSAVQRTAMGVLPGTDRVYSLYEFQQKLKMFKEIDGTKMRENLRYFLQCVVPEADAVGVKLAIHPDDPPFPVFGLPRIAGSEQDFTEIINMVDSPGNGITFCTGSLGVRADNDLPGMVKRLGHRIHFLHLRNVQRLENGSFMEADHLHGDVDMHAVMKALVEEQVIRKDSQRPDIDLPLRPDHGFRMMDDFNRNTYPGYAAIGRMKGLSQLEGLEMGIRRQFENA